MGRLAFKHINRIYRIYKIKLFLGELATGRDMPVAKHDGTEDIGSWERTKRNEWRRERLKVRIKITTKDTKDRSKTVQVTTKFLIFSLLWPGPPQESTAGGVTPDCQRPARRVVW